MSHNLFLVLICIFGVVALAIATPFDLQWTQYFSEHDVPLFSKFMKQSLFNGDWPGAGDLSIFLGLIFLFFYIYFNLKPSSLQKLAQKAPKFRPLLGFLVFTALVSPLLIHVVKIIINRPRPSLVLTTHQYSFYPWYDFPTHFWSISSFSCSFPSGHTASAMYLLAMSYVFYGTAPSAFLRKIGAYVFGVVVLIFACLMSIARAMTLNHWITDSIASMLLMFFFLHISYFWILKLPLQIQTVNENSVFKRLPRFFELHLFSWTLFCALGAVIFSQSIKEIFAVDLKPLWQSALWICFMIFGIVLFSIGITRFYRFKQNVTKSNS